MKEDTLISDSVQKLIKEEKSRYNAVTSSFKWLKESIKDKEDFVYRLELTDPFRAGKIYKFEYVAQTPELPFYDKTPCIISLGQIKYKNSICERGINLNFLPFDVRTYVLNRIHYYFHNTINLEQKGNKKKNAHLQGGLPVNYRSVKNLLHSVYAEYAIRNYFIAYKSNVYNISYEFWDRAALLESDNFEGANLEQIRQDYYNYIRNKNKK